MIGAGWIGLGLALCARSLAVDVTIRIATPMQPPEWAVLERRLLAENVPACREHNVGVIARVPFDEGTLTGTLTKDSKWPAGDWRNTYFVPENLNAAVDRAEALKRLLPSGMTLPEMALRFILANETVGTIIPGMRKRSNVEANRVVHVEAGEDRHATAHRTDASRQKWPSPAEKTV